MYLLNRPALFVLVSLALCQPVVAEESDAAKVGDVLEFALPALALAHTAAARDGEGARQMLYGAVSNLAVTYALKASISKERPDKNDDHSFPSAHTSVTFQAARFVHKRYGERLGKRWVIPMYAAAAFTGYSRIEDDRHDEIDVLAGAALGILASEFFTTRYGGVSVEPLVDGDLVGLRLQMDF